MREKAYSKSPWSKQLLVMSSLATILMLVVVFYLLYNIPILGNVAIFFSALLIVCLLISIALMPLGVEVDDEQIIIHLLLHRIYISKDEIVKIQPFPKNSTIIRHFGIGGVYGYIGAYKSREVGKFTSYATDFNRSFMIYRKDKRPLVVTIDDSTIFG